MANTERDPNAPDVARSAADETMPTPDAGSNDVRADAPTGAAHSGAHDEAHDGPHDGAHDGPHDEAQDAHGVSNEAPNDAPDGVSNDGANDAHDDESNLGAHDALAAGSHEATADGPSLDAETLDAVALPATADSEALAAGEDGHTDLAAVSDSTPPIEPLEDAARDDSIADDEPAADSDRPDAVVPEDVVSEDVAANVETESAASVESESLDGVHNESAGGVDPDEVGDDFARPAAEVRSIVEALIFASPDPLTPKALLKLLDSEPKEDVLSALDELRQDYERPGGLQLVEVAGGFQIVTKPDLHEWVRRLFHERSTQKLSVQALESLAVIAYRQPITAIEITEIRGVNTSGVLNTLLERHLIKIVGRKQVVGRPFMYATTKEFLIRFGLKDIGDLPKVEDMAESLGIESRLLVEQTPAEEQLPLSEPDADDMSLAHTEDDDRDGDAAGDRDDDM